MQLPLLIYAIHIVCVKQISSFLVPRTPRVSSLLFRAYSDREPNESPIKQNGFDYMKLGTKVTENLEAMNIIEPRKIQLDAYDAIRSPNSKNVLLSAETGCGKTLAYTLPLFRLMTSKDDLVANPTSVIMLPNSLLVHQVHCVMSNVFRGTGITVEMVDNIETQEMPSVVIGTPLKVLNKFKVYNMNFKVNVFENVRYLVLDEADQLVEETEEASMREFLKLTRKRVKTVLSAATVSTAGKLSTAKTIERLFKRIQVVKTDKVHSLPSHIDTEFVYCADYEQKVQTVLDVLQQVEPGKRALIFCGSVESSAKLADLLKQMNPRLDVGVVNRNVELPQQLAVLDIDRGNRFIVCTDSLARGLDLGDVSLTIQFDFPTSVLHYIHRTGRSGRNMQLSKTVLLWTDDNREFYHLLYEHRNNLELLFSRKRGLRKKIKRGIAISPIEHKDESSTSQGTDNTFEQHTT